ncbi:MAG: cytochrome c [Acidobacteria bacterium]|nr:cytochrome c [Acidobacteriota bacterium]
MKRLSFIALLFALGLTLACQNKSDESVENAQHVARSSFAIAPQSLEPLMPTVVARAFERSCQSCHGPAGHGIAAIAPDLRKSAMRTTEQWKQFLTATHQGATVPPPTWLNADEINAVANYLVSLRTPSMAPPAITDDDKNAR